MRPVPSSKGASWAELADGLSGSAARGAKLLPS